MPRAQCCLVLLTLLLPTLAHSSHPLAGTDALGDRAEIVTLSARQGQIFANLFDFDAGATSLLGTLTMPQGDLAGRQQLDAVCADFHGDQRQEIVIAYGEDLGPETGRQLVLVVPAIADGGLDWNPDLTTTLAVPDFLLQSPETVQPPIRPVSDGYLRIIHGDFVAEAAGEPARQELLVCGWVLPGVGYASFEARIYRVDDDRNLSEVSRALLDHDAWVFRCPFDVTAADLDGDGVDELVLVRRFKDTSGSDVAYTRLRVYRLDAGTWEEKAEVDIDSWTRGNLGNGVYVNDVDHLAVTAGRFRSGSTQPLIAIGAGHRRWSSTGYPDFPTLQVFASLHHYRVDGTTSETWELVECDSQDLSATTIYPDSYVAISPSLGISNGDLNFDGRDEIVLAGPDKLRVFSVDQDLHLELAAEQPRRAAWDDASRRTVQVVDLDATPGNFVPEILHQQWLVNNPKLDLTPGLTAYWSFDHGWTADAGGAAFDATPVNGPLDIVPEGRYGSSVRLEHDLDQCLEVAAPVIDPEQDHTWSVWHRATWGGGSPEGIPWHVIQSYPAYSVSYYLMNWDGDGYDTRGSVDTQWPGGQANRRFNLETFEDRWQNLVVTYDADQALHTLYLNGEAIATMGSSTSLSETEGLIIGGSRFLADTFDGWIDDVAVWNRVLTGEEIDAIQKQPVIPVDRAYEVVVEQPVLTAEVVEQDTLWTVTGLEAVDSWQGLAEYGNDVAVVVGDFDGDGYRIGDYTHHQGVVATTPTVILKAPPIHFDVLDGTVYDLAGCYPEDCDFWAEYLHSQGSSHTTETVARTSFGLGASLTVGTEFDWLGARAEATVETTYGEHFENSSWGESSVSVDVGVTTWNQDRIHAAVMTYDVYEYAVLGEGAVVGHVAVTVPIEGHRTWYSTDGWLQLFNGTQSPSYPLDHEPGYILSYPADLGIHIDDQLDSDTWEVADSGEFTYSVTYTEISGSEAGTTREFGIEMGSSVSGGGVEVELETSYSSSQMDVFSTEVSEDLQIQVHFGSINNPNARYALRPMLYWSGGTLVVDYEVQPHTTIDHASWWDVNYRDPDPAFILTHRYDEERYPSGGDPGVIKYVTPDITLQPPYAAVGDSQTIRARVRNFSLEDLQQSVEVQFFLGDPDSVWSAGVFIGSAMVPPIAQRGVQEVAIDWQVPPGTPDVGRIWARLETGGLTEVHTGNNKGYAVLQSGTPSAVYDPREVPLALDIRCAPNPFNARTRFDFRLPHGGHTTLCIYDVTGRKVATLVDESLDQGLHSRDWRGTDDQGRVLASGLYLYRIESGVFVNTGKMALVK